MEILFGKVCTFWSPWPTMTCSAISLPFTRKWVRGIVVAQGAFCSSETGCLHHPTDCHNRLPLWSIQSSNTRLHLWWYCVMKPISRTMKDWMLSLPELLLWFAYVTSQGVDWANENRWWFSCQVRSYILMYLDQLKEVGLIETSNLSLIMCRYVSALGCTTAQNAIQDDEAYVSTMCMGIWSHLTSRLFCPNCVS